MHLTARQLNRATLGRQLLLHRGALDVVEAIRRVVALQAQEAASPYIALWNRLAPFHPAELHAAFVDHHVVKASLMRITLHAVHADDYPAFHAAMLLALRASRLHDTRFRQTGLSIADADELTPHLLEFAAQARTGAECEAMLDSLRPAVRARVGKLQQTASRPEPEAGGPELETGWPAKPSVWWALKTFAPVLHAPTGGPWSFGRRPSFVAARTQPHAGDRMHAVQWLIRRYLEGFGPASVQDISEFSRIDRPTIRAAASSMAGTLEHLQGAEGTELLDVPGVPLPDEDTPAPARLMAMWDSTLLAYADRSRIIPPEYRRVIIRQNGDVLPTLLVDGYVAGVWRPVNGGIEVTAFHRLSDETWCELAAEARVLSAFLADLEPMVYSRYGHWWATLPNVEVRVLRG